MKERRRGWESERERTELNVRKRDNVRERDERVEEGEGEGGGRGGEISWIKREQA